MQIHGLSRQLKIFCLQLSRAWRHNQHELDYHHIPNASWIPSLGDNKTFNLLETHITHLCLPFTLYLRLMFCYPKCPTRILLKLAPCLDGVRFLSQYSLFTSRMPWHSSRGARRGTLKEICLNVCKDMHFLRKSTNMWCCCLSDYVHSCVQQVRS